MTDQAPELLPCPDCGKSPGTRVGPPALARCITDGCPGKLLGAKTIAEWNTRPTPAERPVPQVREAIDREEKYLHALIDDEDVGSVMHGDIEGAFHRLQTALSPTVASERVSERETMTIEQTGSSINTQAVEQVWRPISNFEPGDANPNVLVAHDGQVSEAYYDGDSDAWFKAGKSIHDFDFVKGDLLYPTHWMSLPQPPDGSLVLKNEEQSEPVSSPHPEQAGSKVHDRHSLY